MGNKNIAISMSSGKANYHVNQPYIDYIIKAGFTPIALFNKDMCNNSLIDLCDGLLLPGGIDIDPIYYGEDNESSFGVSPEKDEFERELLHMFTNKGKKVFSICRGFQLVVREKMVEVENSGKGFLDGFYYCQHINGHQTNDKNNVGRNIRTHSVLMNKESLYGEGAKNMFVRGFVNSMHHQGFVSDESVVVQTNKHNEMEIIAKHGDINVLAFTPFGINTAGTKKKDRELVIEAADIVFKNTVVRGVQWHPEELMDVGLLKAYFSSKEKVISKGV